MTRAILLFASAAALVLVWRGLVTFPAYAVVAWAAMSVLAGLTIWERAAETPWRRPIRAPRVAAASAVAVFLFGVLAAEIVVLCGFAAGAGIVVALVAAAGWAGKRALAREPRDDGRRVVSVLGTVPDSSTEELCLIWRRTDEELRRAPDGDPERGQLAAVRRLLLDELERRDPEGFRRWLDHGALTGTDPLPFLRTERGLAEPGSSGAA